MSTDPDLLNKSTGKVALSLFEANRNLAYSCCSVNDKTQLPLSCVREKSVGFIFFV